MKLKFTIVLSSLMLIGLAWDYHHQPAASNGSGAPAGRTGSPGDGMSCASGCHGMQPGNPSGNETVTITGLPASGYLPGTTYDLSIILSDASVSKFGFELAAQDEAGNAMGTLIALGGTTQVGPGGAWLTHSPASTTSGMASWDFQWTAPASGSGPVGFYYAALFANGDFSNSGDVTVLGSVMVNQGSSVGISEAELASLSVYPNPVIDQIHVAAKDVDEEIMFTLYNMEGRKVLEQRSKPGDIIIDLAGKSISTGVYFLQMEVDGQFTTKKLFVR